MRWIGIAALVAMLCYLSISAGSPILGTFYPIEISSLLKDAPRYDGRKVAIQGVVSGNAAVMGVGGYRLKSGDAEILVVSSRGIPPAGAERVVKGTFKQMFAIGDLQYGVVIEN